MSEKFSGNTVYSPRETAYSQRVHFVFSPDGTEHTDSETNSKHQSQPLAGLESSELQAATLPSILWLKSTDPRIFTPISLERGQMVRIAFYGKNGRSLVNVYRSISKYIGGGIGIQDEIHPGFENEGVKFNFEFDENGKLVKYSDREDFTPRMQECLALIQGLVSQEGAMISAERVYISDGKEWLEKSLWEKKRALNGASDQKSLEEK